MVFKLSGNELAIIVARLGYSSLYGLVENISRSSREEIPSIIQECELALQKRKYIRRDFEGNSSIDTELSNIVSICSNADRFICITNINEKNCYSVKYVFFKDSECCEMSVSEKHEYELEKTSSDKLEGILLDILNLKDDYEYNSNSFEISYASLGETASMVNEGARKKGEQILLDAGASQEVAEAVINGVLNVERFCTVLFMDLKEEKNSSRSIQIIDSKVLVSMDYVMKDFKDHVKVHCVTAEEIKEKVKEGLAFIRI